MSTATPRPATFLTSSEVKTKIAACIGGTGEALFRKWTDKTSPVLPPHYFRKCARPFYALADVEAALRPSR